MDCGQAMIYRCIDENNKQVLGFINKFHIDNYGQLCFSLHGSFANKYGADLFPVEFFFYKKGKPFYITAKGIAIRKFNREGANKVEEVKLIRANIDSMQLTELNIGNNKRFPPLNLNSFLGL